MDKVTSGLWPVQMLPTTLLTFWILIFVIDLYDLPASPWWAFIALLNWPSLFSELWFWHLFELSNHSLFISKQSPVLLIYDLWHEHPKASLNRNIYFQKAENQLREKGQFSFKTQKFWQIFFFNDLTLLKFKYFTP